MRSRQGDCVAYPRRFGEPHAIVRIPGDLHSTVGDARIAFLAGFPEPRPQLTPAR